MTDFENVVKEVVGVVVFIIKQIKMVPTGDLRIKFLMTENFGLNEENRQFAVVAPEGGWCIHKVVRIIMFNPLNNPLPLFIKISLILTKECHKITFRTYQERNSCKYTITI